MSLPTVTYTIQSLSTSIPQTNQVIVQKDAGCIQHPVRFDVVPDNYERVGLLKMRPKVASSIYLILLVSEHAHTLCRLSRIHKKDAFMRLTDQSSLYLKQQSINLTNLQEE